MGAPKTQDDVKDPDALVANQERADNAELKAIPGKAVDAVRQLIMESDAKNSAAAASMKAQDQQNPDTFQAKVNRFTNYGGYKKGGKVSGASKRADGIAIRGKTKGQMR